VNSVGQATLLGEMIRHLKKLKTNAAQNSEGSLMHFIL